MKFLLQFLSQVTVERKVVDKIKREQFGATFNDRFLIYFV